MCLRCRGVRRAVLFFKSADLLLSCDVFPCDRYVSVLRLVAALFCMLAGLNLTLLASGMATVLVPDELIKSVPDASP
jgi:hypothetical protein